MKEILNARRYGVVGMLLFVLAMVFGGGAALAAAGAATSIDMNEPSPDTKNLDTELGSVGASATLTNESDIEAREIDRRMVMFTPYKLPELQIKVNLKNTYPVTKYYIEYPTAGATPLDFTIDYTATASANSEEATWHVHNDEGGAAGYEISEDCFRALTETTTFVLEGVQGYRIPDDETASTAEPDGDLMLQVTLQDEGNKLVKVTPINGWAKVSGSWKSVMPTSIAAGTEIHIMATACSESQWEVAPENYLPVTKNVYLQKQVTNLVLTDDFLRQMKEIEFGKKELNDRAIYNMNRKASRTFWLGAEGKKQVRPGKHMSKEDVFYTRGVLRQVLNKIAVDGDIDFDLLNQICDIQFGVNSLTDQATVFIGSKFNLKLMKLFTENAKGNVTLSDFPVDSLKLSFKQYTLNAVGTLNFIHSKTLDDIGYSECAVVLDTDNMTRYVKFDLQQNEVDMKKGGGPNGETRQAERSIYCMADAVSTRGCNSILIGPSKKIFGAYSENEMDADILTLTDTMLNTYTLGLDPDATKSTSAFYSGNTAFATAVGDNDQPKDGVRIYLGADDPYTGFSAGTIVIWSASESTWKKYSGPITITGNEA
jgi:hypothetical protein